MKITDPTLIMEKNAIVINEEIHNAVNHLETSGALSCVDHVINYSDINYIATLALLVRKYRNDIYKFTLEATYAIDACEERLLRDSEVDYELEYKNIFNLSSRGLETMLRSMGYTNPVVFALFLIEENKVYRQYKTNNNTESITVDNGNKTGVAKSLV